MPPVSRTDAPAVRAPAATWHPVAAEGQPAAGSYVHDGPALTTGWHRHDLHQLEYACSGTMGLETELARFVLAPHQAAWIPAGTNHISTLGGARTISVFLAPDRYGDCPQQAAALVVTPLLREMVLHSVRWPLTRTTPDPVAEGFFTSLALLLPGWVEDCPPVALPVSSAPLTADAIAYTLEHLTTVTHARLSRALCTSERSLRRHFLADTGMTWREYVSLARLLKALGVLAASDDTISQVAATVGFSTPTAFSRAFLQRTGQTPSAYRRRVAPRPHS